MGIRLQLLSAIRCIVEYVIIIFQNLTIYKYVALVIKETTTHKTWYYVITYFTNNLIFVRSYSMCLSTTNSVY